MTVKEKAASMKIDSPKMAATLIETRNKALEAIAEALLANKEQIFAENAKDLEEELLTAKKDRVFITHSGCDREIVDSVRVYLESLNHFDEILETTAGSIITSHCGQGTIGVLFIYNK